MRPELETLLAIVRFIDVNSLPLYKKVKEALAEPTFMENEGYLEIYCRHAYAHSTISGIETLLAVLKGPDMESPSDYDDSGEEMERATAEPHDHVRPLQTVVTRERGVYDGEDSNDILREVGGGYFKVNWLTEPLWRSVGLVHLIYGNHAGINTVYTYAALVIGVPSVNQRRGITGLPVELH
ncbi:uncharacterized protein BDR25DRAFT_312919 [Lindgomyces ingoldianus]|uniref:Uncharacterized protein n=1 Tax=Lindgomyces ingoldianus TaxID=673940 RepID=A0ACB6QZL5_9PLEO|nr:uncharacterized protein BDR25DRAFT_312919 [Lindgomyces ingoldianus]KAF2472366.1 hypothetical protein BDR25DRAFT_312919 [Lindgomyces ingoldianus]